MWSYRILDFYFSYVAKKRDRLIAGWIARGGRQRYPYASYFVALCRSAMTQEKFENLKNFQTSGRIVFQLQKWLFCRRTYEFCYLQKIELCSVSKFEIDWAGSTAIFIHLRLPHKAKRMASYQPNASFGSSQQTQSRNGITNLRKGFCVVYNRKVVTKTHSWDIG